MNNITNIFVDLNQRGYLIFSSITLIIAILLYVILKSESNSIKSPQDHVDISTGLKNEIKGSIDLVVSDDDKVLNPAKFKEFTILQIKHISYNTKLLRIEIPFGKALNLPLGRHISLKADIDGNRVIRAYTPTTKSNQTGYFDLLIKSYDLGKLSPYLHSLKVGSKVEVRGPVGRFHYVKNSFPIIGLIAGGTGITPCLQVLRCILDGGLDGYQDDKTIFVLFYQNRKEEDILLKTDLDEMTQKYPSRFEVTYFLSNPTSSSWIDLGNQKKGYIGVEDIKRCFSVDKVPFVCLCGPSGFNSTIKDILQAEGGHTDSSIYVW